MFVSMDVCSLSATVLHALTNSLTLNSTTDYGDNRKITKVFHKVERLKKQKLGAVKLIFEIISFAQNYFWSNLICYIKLTSVLA